MGWKRDETARQLGLGISIVGFYENGNRPDNKPVKIPLVVALAMAAREFGITPAGEEK